MFQWAVVVANANTQAQCSQQVFGMSHIAVIIMNGKMPDFS